MPCRDCDKSLCACAPRLTHARRRPLAQTTRKLSVSQSVGQRFDAVCVCVSVQVFVAFIKSKTFHIKNAHKIAL